MRKLLPLITLPCLVTSTTVAAGNLPKREFRGAWIATVVNLDWPSSPGLAPETQRTELTTILNGLKAAGVNAVVFQVRPECDAFYASSFEPWSYWLTGQQGQAPSPYYDPLQFAIAETHKRGMELHAWFNPYRAVRQIGQYPPDPRHVSVLHPEWLLTFGNFKMLDPGLPMVRDYITKVVLDVVQRYDVDGVHFDDYFYPYPPNQIANEDDATFAYSRGFTDRGDWRRDNVNLLVKMVHDSIQVVKPYVKFGISPFGIWKNGVPPGITGLDAYSVIYCDALAWLNQRTIDYITPQLYWPFGGAQDYGKLLPWWASQTNGRHMYVGQAAYRIGIWSASEVPHQIRANRSHPQVQGSIFFRSRFGLLDNPRGFLDSLKTDLYRYPSLSPVMEWKDSVPPNAPRNLRYERIAGAGAAALQWDLPLIAADGDTASRYVVYRFDHEAIASGDLDDPSHIVEVAGRRVNSPGTPAGTGPYYYVVTGLDRNSNESAMSNVLAVWPPPRPLLALPADGAPNQAPTVTLSWYYPSNAASYHVQVSVDSTFAATLLVNDSGIVDTFRAVAGMEGQATYYWRVRARNAGGTGEFSEVRRFSTGFPATPLLASPANNAIQVSLNPTLSWHRAPGASSYRVQLARSLNFDPASVEADVSGLVDTAYSLSRLRANTAYFWRVTATNDLGTSRWSSTWRFKTTEVTWVADASDVPSRFELYQNYPNPFNPATTIAFDLPTPGVARLVVYDVLGREVTRLVNEALPAGRHEVVLDAWALPSGIYVYRLAFGGMSLTRKMTVLK